MYSDPTKKRTNVVKLRFSAAEDRVVDAYVRNSGEQRAVLLRETILEKITASLQKNFHTKGLTGQNRHLQANTGENV